MGLDKCKWVDERQLVEVGNFFPDEDGLGKYTLRPLDIGEWPAWERTWRWVWTSASGWTRGSWSRWATSSQMRTALANTLSDHWTLKSGREGKTEPKMS